MKRMTFLCLMIILCAALLFCACSGGSEHTVEKNPAESRDTSEINAEALAAYETVMSQYKSAAELISFKEFLSQEGNFPDVASRVMSRCYSVNYECFIYYCFYDLNEDGISELLIASDWDGVGHEPEINDIFVYDEISQEVKSLFKREWKVFDQDISYGCQFFSDNTFEIGQTYMDEEDYRDITTKYGYYKLNEDGTELTELHLLSQQWDNYRVNGKKTDKDSYFKIQNSYRELNSNPEEWNEDDIPYEVLASTKPKENASQTDTQE